MEESGPDTSAAPGSFSARSDNGPTDFDQAMAGLNGSNVAGTQSPTAQDSLATSPVDGTTTSNTSATSFQSDDPPAHNAGDDSHGRGTRGSKEPIPSIDEQVGRVMAMIDTPLEEGARGVVISYTWLARVLSRATDGRNSSEFLKSAREGPIGPLDSSDIIADGGLSEPILKDSQDHAFVPLKPGLAYGADFQVVPHNAYGLIAGWYGIVPGQTPIIRYAHNTAPSDAVHTNIQYELFPPIFTVRRVPHPGQDGESKGGDKSRKAAIELRLRKERKSRGQMSPEDALRLVSSRFEKCQPFLTRAKEYAGVENHTKVKVWRSLKPTSVIVDEPDSRPTDDASLSNNGSARLGAVPAKLVVEPGEWEKLEIGKDIEHVDVRDETSNAKYNGGSTMETFSLFDDQTLILEEQQGGGDFSSDQKNLTTSKKTGSKPRSTDASEHTSPAPSGGIMTRGRARRDGKTRGTVGLTNLGNTCYMNSALQCIRSVEELAVYFLEDRYKQEINVSNPLGHRGAMANKYAEVLRNIYSDSAAGSFSPLNFKKTLGSIMPIFSGFGQQDSQEFLSFLVDALHEDLNRIEKKPYLENPDSDDKRVSDPEYIIELGEQYRSNHRARNDSIAMDLFSGFYKNTMECPICDKVSVTFDPYSLLTVQLPVENMITHSFIFFPRRGRPIKHDLDVERSFTVRDLKRLIASKHPGVDAAKLWMVEIFSNKFHKLFEDGSVLAEANIQSGDIIYFFELDQAPTHVPTTYRSGYSFFSTRREATPASMDSDAAASFAVPIFHRQKRQPESSWKPLLHPQYISLTREEAKDFDVILKKTLLAVADMTSRPFLTEAEDEADKEDHSGDADADASPAVRDEAARVSDHSVKSEDGYVAVSIDAMGASADTASSAADTGDEAKGDDVQMPRNFMDTTYRVPRLLRDQLFNINYSKYTDGTYNSSGYDGDGVKSMQSRVRVPSRRGSTDSGNTEQSTISDRSSPAKGEVEESDEDEEESQAPSTINGESPLSLADERMDDAESAAEDGLPINPARSGRRGANGKGNKFKDGKRKDKNRNKTASKRDTRRASNRKDKGTVPSKSQRSTPDLADAQDDDTYYLRVGECIVLDWIPAAFDGLFNGKSSDADDFRGHETSPHEGKGLPVFDDAAVKEGRDRRASRRKHGITLGDCFAETGKREKLSEDNAWYCNRCKELRQATKTLEIWTLPDILVVHLKRFGGNRRFQDKIDVLVDYPVEGLDLEGKVGMKEKGKEYVYDLFAIDNHYGGLGGGHYTAAAKNFFDGQWYEYNGELFFSPAL